MREYPTANGSRYSGKVVVSKSRKPAKKPAKKSTALAVRDTAQINPQTEPALALVERFARDPHFDVEKMRALLDMRDRELARVAEHDFNQSINRAQQRMRAVATDADNPQTKSRYATYRKLDAAIRPIYTEDGFGISFDTADSPKGVEYVRVLAYVSHVGGFSRTYKVDMPADGKGAKGGDVMTKTHAVGAAASYGMRYLLKMIFNIAVGEEDRDGNRVASPKSRKGSAPEVVPDDAAVPPAVNVSTINTEQEKRLWSVSRKCGRIDADVILWLKQRYQVKATKAIRQSDYNAIVRQLEARGALALPGDGEA